MAYVHRDTIIFYLN